MGKLTILAFLIFVFFKTCTSSNSSGTNYTKECSKLDFNSCDSDGYGQISLWTEFSQNWQNPLQMIKNIYKTKSPNKMVGCFFPNWATYREGAGKFTPDDIDASLCTHVYYAFASLNNASLTITMSDAWADSTADGGLGYYEKIVALTKKGINVMLSIGGWNDSEGDKWSRMMKTADTRAKFIQSVVEFLKKYGFQGLDLDYEYPGCPQGTENNDTETNKENFNKLVFEMMIAFKGEYALSVDVPGGKNLINNCYDMSPLCNMVDWINVMGYEYHSASDGPTAPSAPICGYNNSWGVYETLQYYIHTLKCPTDKMALGIPFYGKSYTAKTSESLPGFGVAVSGPGTAGNYTKSAGNLAYYEICQDIKNSGYQYKQDNLYGSYAWKDNQFISYDGVNDISKKSCLIKKLNLKGGMFWELSQDDFSDTCGCGKWPLLKALNTGLGRLNLTSPISCY